MFFLVERYFALVWLLNDENMQHSMLDLICGRATADAPVASTKGTVPTKEEAPARHVERRLVAGRPRSREKVTDNSRRKSSQSLKRLSSGATSSVTSLASLVSPTAPQRKSQQVRSASSARYKTERSSATPARTFFAFSSAATAQQVSKSTSSFLPRGSVTSPPATEDLQEDAGDEQLLQGQQPQARSARQQQGARAFDTVGVHAKVRLSIDSLASFSPRLPAAENALDACTDSTHRESVITRALQKEAAAHTADVEAYCDRERKNVAVGGSGNTRTGASGFAGSSAVGTEAEDAALESKEGSAAGGLLPRRRHSVAMSMLLGDAFPRRAAAAAPRRHSSSSLHDIADATVTAASHAGRCLADTFVDAPQRQKHAIHHQRVQQRGEKAPQLYYEKQQLQETHHQEILRRRVLRKPMAVSRTSESSIISSSGFTSNRSFTAVDALWGPVQRLATNHQLEQREGEQQQQQQRPSVGTQQQGKQQQVREQQQQQVEADSHEQPRYDRREGEGFQRHPQQGKPSATVASTTLLQEVLQPQNTQLPQHQQSTRKRRSRRRGDSRRSSIPALGTAVG